MIGHGVSPASDGVTAGLTTIAPAGVMKVPHAVAMHAIQVLPVLAWLVGFADLPERRRLGLVWAAAAGNTALVAASVARTAAGRAPFDLGAAAALSLADAALFGTAYAAALQWTGRRAPCSAALRGWRHHGGAWLPAVSPPWVR
jgi:hypothetical protein